MGFYRLFSWQGPIAVNGEARTSAPVRGSKACCPHQPRCMGFLHQCHYWSCGGLHLLKAAPLEPVVEKPGKQ